MFENIVLNAVILKKMQPVCRTKGRGIISGISIEDTHEGRYYVATSGTLLVVYKDEQAKGEKLKNPITLRLENKIKEEKLSFSLRVVDGMQAVLINKIEIVGAELLEGKFPDWRAFIPKKIEKAEKYVFVSPMDLAIAARFVNIDNIPGIAGQTLYWKDGAWEVVVLIKKQIDKEEEK